MKKFLDSEIEDCSLYYNDQSVNTIDEPRAELLMICSGANIRVCLAESPNNEIGLLPKPRSAVVHATWNVGK